MKFIIYQIKEKSEWQNYIAADSIKPLTSIEYRNYHFLVEFIEHDKFSLKENDLFLIFQRKKSKPFIVEIEKTDIYDLDPELIKGSVYEGTFFISSWSSDQFIKSFHTEGDWLDDLYTYLEDYFKKRGIY